MRKCLFLLLFLTACIPERLVQQARDRDGDGFVAWQLGGLDCDDSDFTVSPDAEERCGDGIDNDCDGVIDDDGLEATTFYVDADGDGYGDPDATETACSLVDGLASNPDDCDDSDPEVSPSATEICGNHIDDDCDGAIDDDGVGANIYYADTDGDGHGDAEAPVTSCSLTEGLAQTPDDCDDTDGDISPSAEEICGNDIDDNCDNVVDDDGRFADTFYADNDGDGHGDPDVPVSACSLREGISETADDCDDGDRDISPSEDEVCKNGIDDNCDGSPAPCLFSGAIDLADSDVLYLGLDEERRVGRSLAMGDIDDDGHADLVVGSGAGGPNAPGDGGVDIIMWDDLVDSVLYPSDADHRLGLDANFGNSVFTCDIDENRRADALAWAAYWYTNSGFAVIDAATWEAYATLPGNEDATTLFGTQELLSANGRCGDFNGDGTHDVAFGYWTAPGWTDLDNATYRVQVHHGPFQPGAIWNLENPAWAVGPTSSNDTETFYVSHPGDLNADGSDDLMLVYAESNVAYVFSGQNAGELAPADADVTIEGTATITLDGPSILGDFDGDGHQDVALEASDGSAGRILLLYGPLDFDGTPWLSVTDFDSGIVGTETRPGHRPHNAGDLDADGSDELVLAAAAHELPTDSRGMLLLFYGGRRLSQPISTVDADAVFSGEAAGDKASTVSLPGDLNADGYDDLVIGASRASSIATRAGKVYVLYGSGG